ncbi:MAG TPA: hypothetical protein ENK18_09835 [Deltaproteobacteria bacterium]|nr:hypothetical protein [Deltaproteobacteria bacterium]
MGTRPPRTRPPRTRPRGHGPADTAPADTAPADTAPADTAPADTAPWGVVSRHQRAPPPIPQRARSRGCPRRSARSPGRGRRSP